ncbi:carboxylate--amine ligase [Bifidobacterium psychraerophilum]|uniref:carboxylate--amine ligase n=1 Tax=Bifidobacterium psychraerophilum TaxID=218140 RepID=UPI0039ED73B0
MSDFEAVLLGSETGAYAMARAFHSEYGIRSHVFGRLQLSVSKFSSIMETTFHSDLTEPEAFRTHMLQAGSDLRKRYPGSVLLLIPCGDDYSALLSRYRDELSQYFTFTSVNDQLHTALSYKSSFYDYCERYDLPHPKTLALSKQAFLEGRHRALPFAFPVALKPADSVEYLSIDFPGRKKAYTLGTQEELNEVVDSIYGAGYSSDIIIQDFIPGGDGNMRVLNAYVDQHHQVRMMFLGHVLLADPTPEAIGNYAAIIPDFNESLCLRIKHFLEDIRYEGVANFDLKFDPRDGEYKLFEINLRQGRTNFFVSLNGFNLARYFVDDLVYDKPFDGDTLIGKGSKMLLEVPPSVLKRYAEAGEAKERGLAMLRDKRYSWTLRYGKDMSFKRRLLLWRLGHLTSKNYARYED